METPDFVQLLPYLLSIGLSLVVISYAWKHRAILGAREFSFYLLSQTLWFFTYLLNLFSTTLEAKIFWDKLNWLAAGVGIVALPLFVVRYANLHIRRAKILLSALVALPAAFAALLATDQIHHLVYVNPKLVEHAGFSIFSYEVSWAVYAFAIPGYIILLGSILVLILKFPRSNPHFKVQLAIISIGAALPVVGTVFAFSQGQLTPQNDLSPWFSIIGSLLLTWGLFQFRILGFLPLAREKIVEDMDDMIVVLDENDCVVDINRKALEFLKIDLASAKGKKGSELFADWTGMLTKFSPPGNFTSEEFFEVGGEYLHYDVKSTLLNDQSGNNVGRIIAIRDVSSYAHLQWELKALNEHLEERVMEQTKEIQESYETTLEGWAKALELRDKETEGHSRRVVEETLLLARALGVSENEIVHLHRGAILHDIGKMAIPDEVLHKQGTLTDEDWQNIRRHPDAANHLLENIPYLQKAMDIPWCHHEHWDGSGYPRGLKGEEIPLAARIFTVVDVWDALLSDRNYRPAWSRQDVIRYIEENSGKLFDPLIDRSLP